MESGYKSPLARTHSSSAGSRSPEQRKFVAMESANILSKNTMEREQLKHQLSKSRKEKEIRDHKWKEQQKNKWTKLTARSPFAVDLVAEDERIHEENRIRLAEEEERRRAALAKREKAKNDIVLKALAEFSDLEALRREKRAITEEEQRLKALLALEKTKGHGKKDRLAAERAQRQRREAKSLHRRQQYKDSLDAVLEEEAFALRKKHGLDSTTGSEEFRVTR